MIEPPKIPGLSELLAPGWVWIVSAISAVVGYLEDFSMGDPWRVWIYKALAKSSSSALAGLLAYRFALAMGMSQSWHVIVVAIAAHMGTEFLKAGGGWLKKKLGFADS